MRTVVLAGAVAVTLCLALTAQTKYGVKAEVDGKTDFSKLKTYSWSTRYDAMDKEVHALIVASIDKQMAALGFAKQEAGGDVTVVYDALRRTDVDVKSKGKDGEQPRISVGTLILRLVEPSTQRNLFRARLDKPITTDRSALAAEIDAAVASVFEKYPTRTRSKS